MTERHPHLSPEDEADLVALADGNLHPARRAEVEARVAGDPVLTAALERQRAALAALATLTTAAPPQLRQRVAELQQAATRRRRRWRWLPVPIAAGLAAAAAGLLLVLTGGGPSLDDVMAVALRPATAPAATGERIDGLAFPRPGAWRAVGARSDTVAGRATRTVFYERAGVRIAYTIVAGEAVDGRRWLKGPDGRVAFTWVRDGRTCVISGADRAALVKAAAWR